MDAESWLAEEIAARTGRRPAPPLREASFEELGLDSLAAVELAGALAARLGRELPEEVLFERPTIGALLAELEAEGAGPAPVALPAPHPQDAPFRLTEIQHAYWVGRTGFLALGDVSCHFYAELEVEDLDVKRLEAALDRLVARHDALRIVIGEDGRQRVLSEVPPCEVEVVDLSRAEDFEAACERERERVSHEIRPADRWPLFGWRLLDRGAGCGVLQVSYDLLIADAASLLILTEELARLYAEPAAELEPLGVSFAQCVLSEPPPEALERARAYWRERL
ncbi:MAG TPA: condensation domain-containing protein, partial [Solirubrobacterales bacterium]|nr:condensation domain-containing protein [Solirubrobacterales bacterium]